MTAKMIITLTILLLLFWEVGARTGASGTHKIFPCQARFYGVVWANGFFLFFQKDFFSNNDSPTNTGIGIGIISKGL